MPKRKRINYTEIAKELGPRLDKRATILENGCWIIPSTRLLDNQEKGIQTIQYNGHGLRIQRIMWVYYKGALKTGVNIKTSCDTPNCINPEHMTLETQGRSAEELAMIRGRRKPTLSPTPTPVIEPEPAIEALKPYIPKAAQLSEEEVMELKAFLRLMRGIRAYLNHA